MPWHAKPETTSPDPCDGCDNQCCVGECEHAACLADPTRPDWQPFEWTCDGCEDQQPECVDPPAVEVDGRTYCCECAISTFAAILQHGISTSSLGEVHVATSYTDDGKLVVAKETDLVRAVRAVVPKDGTDAD
jgi:hypothetical protein